MTEKKNMQSKEAQDALDSIDKMQHAGLKHILPTPLWLGAVLGLLLGTQIALLGAEIRAYNTILIVLIVVMVIAIMNKTQSAGVTERVLLSKQAILIRLVCIIPLYFLAIIGGQYLNNNFDYFWAPYVIGTFFAIGIWSLLLAAHRSHSNISKKDRK